MRSDGGRAGGHWGVDAAKEIGDGELKTKDADMDVRTGFGDRSVMMMVRMRVRMGMSVTVMVMGMPVMMMRVRLRRRMGMRVFAPFMLMAEAGRDEGANEEDRRQDEADCSVEKTSDRHSRGQKRESARASGSINGPDSKGASCSKPEDEECWPQEAQSDTKVEYSGVVQV